jgi:hypothetical protein
MRSLKSWLEKAFAEDHRPRAERRKVPGLEALHGIGPASEVDDVKDISATGIYILTKERWPQGEVHALKLTSEVEPKEADDHEVVVQAKTVRWGDDGVGLAFMLPPGMELWLWKAEEHPEPEEVLNEFRVARAVAFLKRICPAATNELNLLFREGLSNLRIRNSIEIALHAEEILAGEPDGDKMRAPKNIVLRITENGSWSDSTLTQRLWAGLLACACKAGGQDQSTIGYIETLSQLATMHSRLFDAACTRAAKIIGADGTVSAQPLAFTADQLIEITEAHDLMRVDRNLTQLSDLGLIYQRVKSKYFTWAEDANVTPTSLGLEMYARCQGHIGAASDYYREAATNAQTTTN